MKINRSILILTTITIIAFILRFFMLDLVPPSLNWDEASHGYNAYSLLKTGKDEWGFSFPTIFCAFGDYKLPVYIYLTTIPIFFLGLNLYSVRLVSVIAGALAIPAIYLLTKQLLPKQKNLPLIASFLLTITPWHLFISRPALEANLSLTFIILGFYFFIKDIRAKKISIIGSILLCLSLHTYNTARIFVPTMLIATLFIYRPKLKFSPSLIVAFLIWSVSSLLILLQIINGTGLARYGKLSIINEQSVFSIGEMRSKSSLPSFLPRLVYNRPVYFVSQVFRNYISYFSPQFFWQTTGTQTQFAIPNQNILGLPIFSLFIASLIILIFRPNYYPIDSQSRALLISWLFLSPLAASLTSSPPQALRPNPLIPVTVIIAAILLSKFKQKILLLASILSLFSFCLYINNYVNDYRRNYSSSWQYGYEEALNFVRENSGKYQRVFITKRYGEPHIFYLFYNALDPKTIQSGNTIRFFQSDWYWTDKIENVYFVNDWNIPSDKNVSSLKLESGSLIDVKGGLLVTSPDHIPSNMSILKTVKLLDGNPVFVIGKINE